MDLTITNTQIASDAAIALSKLSDGSKIVLNDGTVTLAANLNAGGYKLTNLGDGSADGDSCTYGQLQAVATEGKAWKEVLLYSSQVVDGASGGILAANVITLNANLQTGDTITLHDGSSSENYVADTDFSVGVDIDATLSNLSTAVNAGAIAISTVVSTLETIDSTNNVLIIYQDTIGEATRVYGNAGAAARVEILPTSTLYEGDSSDLVALPSSDPAATNFGFSRAFASLVDNETHYCRECDGSYSWDSDDQVWNLTGAASIPFASTSVHGKMKVHDGLTATDGVVGVDLTANDGLTLSGSSPDKTISVDYDNATIGIVSNQLAVITDGIDATHIDWGTGANQVSQDDVVDGSTYKQYNPASVDINGGAIDSVTLGTASAITEAQVDNININGNSIISTDTNGDISITPDGTGEVNISKVDIDSGTIDGCTIATSDVTVGVGKTLDVSAGTLTLANDQISGDKVEGGTIASITITSLDANGGSVDAATLGTNSAITEAQIDNINVNGNSITSTDTNGDISITPDGTGEVNISKVDIDAGTIDGCTIATSDVTVGVGKTLDVSAGTLTLANDQISGDKVEGGTINATTINTLTSTSVLGTTFDTNVAAAGVTLSGTTLSADGSDDNIDISITTKGTGEVNLNRVDIDAGAIDAVTLGTNSAVTEAQIDNINIDGNSIISTDTDGDISLTPNGTGEVNISKVDIDSGTIDGCTIATSDVTVGVGKTLDVSAGTLTLANDQISGDKVEGGTIASITITSLDANGGSVDAATLGTNSAITEAQIDNININGNSIISTDTNGDISLTPDGTGEVNISKVDIDAGAIDAVTLGTNSAVTEAQIDNININGNSIISTDTNGDINLTPDGTGEVNISKVDIDAGTIDGTDVTVGAGKTLDVSGGTLTCAASQVLGSYVQLAATSAIEDSTGLKIKAATAGNGLTISSQILAVGAGNGISVAADAVAVNLDGSTLSVSGSGLKLADLTDGWVLMGNGSNVATKMRSVTREAPNESPDGSRTAFTVDYTPRDGTEQVFINGILQIEGGGESYTLSSKTITFTEAPTSGDKIRVNYLATD